MSLFLTLFKSGILQIKDYLAFSWGMAGKPRQTGVSSLWQGVITGLSE